MADQLPAKLRAWADESHPTWHGAPMVREAADTIDAQAAEIERLREALTAYINDYVGDDGMYAPKHYAQIFRAALEQTK